MNSYRLFSILIVYGFFFANVQISLQNEEGVSKNHIECEEDFNCTEKWGTLAICDLDHNHCICQDGTELKSNSCVSNVLDLAEGKRMHHDHHGDDHDTHLEDEVPAPAITEHVPVEESEPEPEESIIARSLAGASCKVDKDCHDLQDAKCEKSKCVCSTDFIVNGNRTKCLPIAKEVGWGCEEDVQCTVMLNKTTECSDFTCSCKSGTVFKDGKCVESKGLDAFCESSMVCTVEHSECSQGICACMDGYVPAPDNMKCLEIAQGFRARCQESIQCSNPFGPNAVCLNNQCECRTGHHFAEMKCWLDKGLTDKCTSNVECHIPDDETSQKLECDGGQCICRAEFVADLSTMRCNGVSLPIASLTSLLILLLHVFCA